jgi:hypothetical protein
MIRTTRFIAATLTALGVVACQKDDTAVKTTSTGETNVSAPADSAQARGHSMVRIVNAVRGGPDVSASLDGGALFNDVKAASVTDYREITTNLAKFSVNSPGATNGMMPAEKDRILMDGNRYSVFVISEDVSKNALRVLKDDVTPDSGKALLRVVHAAPGAPEMDVTMTGATKPIFTGINFMADGGYKDVSPAKMTLEVRAKNTTPILLRVTGLDLRKGSATTVVITGAGKLGSFHFTDTPMPRSPKL